MLKRRTRTMEQATKSKQATLVWSVRRSCSFPFCIAIFPSHAFLTFLRFGQWQRQLYVYYRYNYLVQYASNCSNSQAARQHVPRTAVHQDPHTSFTRYSLDSAQCLSRRPWCRCRCRLWARAAVPPPHLSAERERGSTVPTSLWYQNPERTWSSAGRRF